MDKETRNSKLAKSFYKYCQEHPQMRFWQALLSWSELPYICWTKTPFIGDLGGDTFHWEEKNK